jgi:antitoxin (DNA-binding transcriptional repressor) of toxin-antitoxin stability system
MNATIVDLRYNMKNVLRAIDRGETVTVLYRGKERAKLTPITPAPSSSAPKTKDQPLFGLWKDREDMSDPASYLRHLRLPRRAPVQASIGKQLRSRKLR